MGERLIKSKERKTEYAEVGTPKKIVDKMLGVVKEAAIEDGTYSPFMRYFEPACGWGNFLEPILEDKLDYLLAHDMWNAENIKMAVGSIYAVDIQEDNVKESGERLYNRLKEYLAAHPTEWGGADEVMACIILSGNIVSGDTINEPEKITFPFYKLDDNGELGIIGLRSLSDMLGEDYMKDLEKRRKKQAKANHAKGEKNGRK